MYITVIGGGNSTPIFACLSKLAGHKVAILTRRPNDWSKDVGFINQDAKYLNGEGSFHAEIDLITNDPALCIPQADLIFLAGIPIHHNPEILREKIAPHLDRSKRVFIGSICAYGGFNWVAADCLGDGNYVLFGTQLIPWCCGYNGGPGPAGVYGKTSKVFGAKRMLRIATEDGRDQHGLKEVLNSILKIPELRDTDFLASTLWPNNPSLHPPILFGLFKEWDGVTPYDRSALPTRIYAELQPRSAEYVQKLDDELVAIVGALSKLYPENPHLKLDFSLAACIIENYEDQVTDKSSTEATVRTNKAFGCHCIPYTDLGEGKVVPVLAHKFFETDLPFGLCTFKDIALMLGVVTPTIDEIIEWNQKLIKKEYLKDGKIIGKDAKECILPSAFGLDVHSLGFGKRSLEE